ncbi:MAG: TAXI family TRAP transporter solute-binding subunit [Bacteroidales bacterium]|nr:TAXI family TRAP transporter solute-binding subunit [Bacteroidales bacterium]
MFKKIFLLSFISVLMSGPCLIAQIEILSGPKQGSYYQIVEDIKDIVGSTAFKPFVNQESSGAAYNFDQLVDMNTRFKLAMMQADYLEVMKATDQLNNTEKTKNLKVVIPLADEEIHVVVKESSGIKGLQDLENKIVAIGSPTQGTYATATFMKKRSKINWVDQKIHLDQALKELKDDKIHAFIFVGSAPIEKINIDPAVMVDPLTVINLEDFNGWAKPYEKAVIKKGIYKWMEADISTFSVKSALVVNEAKLTNTDRSEITRMLDAIKANRTKLNENGHPAWKTIDLEDWSETDWPMFK